MDRPREALLLFCSVVAAPMGGAAIMVWLFTRFVRPALDWPGWSVDTLTIVAGAAGIVMGGMLFYVTASAPRERAVTDAGLLFRVPAQAAAVALVLLAAGVPLAWWWITGIGMLAAGSFGVSRFRHSR